MEDLGIRVQGLGLIVFGAHGVWNILQVPLAIGHGLFWYSVSYLCRKAKLQSLTDAVVGILV